MPCPLKFLEVACSTRGSKLGNPSLPSIAALQPPPILNACQQRLKTWNGWLVQQNFDQHLEMAVLGKWFSRPPLVPIETLSLDVLPAHHVQTVLRLSAAISASTYFTLSFHLLILTSGVRHPNGQFQEGEIKSAYCMLSSGRTRKSSAFSVQVEPSKSNTYPRIPCLSSDLLRPINFVSSFISLKQTPPHSAQLSDVPTTYLEKGANAQS